MSAGVVHVIDDDAGVRESLQVLLQVAGFSVEAYASAEAFLEVADRAASGCVVTDVHMPEMSGLDLLRRLSGRRARFAVIVLTGEADVPMAVEALKAGALDFIQKPYRSEAIVAAVTSCQQRLTSETARTSRRADVARRLAALSARERDVLGGVLKGHSNKEIARDLDISPRTVEAYRANLMMKTGAENLSDLVRMAIEAEGD